MEIRPRARVFPPGILALFLFSLPLPATPPPLILVSLDGFHPDYRTRYETPHLDMIVEEGVAAEWLIPVFPTKTFPNHFSIVTGLYPEEHGIVSNKFFDPVLKDQFEMGDTQDQGDPKWWGGEPIWVTAEKQGLRTATYFWPGSEAPIKGIRPTHWRPYDGGVPNEKRVDQVLKWLDLPDGQRPSLITLYFSTVDSVGHKKGPGSPEIAEAVESLDRQLGRLMEGLKDRNLRHNTHLLIVSDHGMSGLSPERVVYLDDYIDLKQVDIIEWTPVLFLRPHTGKEEEVFSKLHGAHPKLKVYRKGELPMRLHFDDNARITPIIGVAEDGWTLSHRGLAGALKKTLQKGTHGYDKAHPSMRGIFYAAGPRFVQGTTLPPFECIHLYSLMSHLLEVEPAPNSGDGVFFDRALKPSKLN